MSSMQNEPSDRALGLVLHQQRANLRRVRFVSRYVAPAVL